MYPPGTEGLPFQDHHPNWFRSLINVYVGHDSMTALAERFAERELHADVLASLALPPGHPPWIYHWPIQGRITRVYGRLSPSATAELMDELTRYRPHVLTAHDDQGLMYCYPRSIMQ